MFLYFRLLGSVNIDHFGNIITLSKLRLTIMDKTKAIKKNTKAKQLNTKIKKQCIQIKNNIPKMIPQKQQKTAKTSYLPSIWSSQSKRKYVYFISLKENQLQLPFIDEQTGQKIQPRIKIVADIFREISQYIFGCRQKSTNCRNFHQHLIRKYKSFQKIIKQLGQQHQADLQSQQYKKELQFLRQKRKQRYETKSYADYKQTSKNYTIIQPQNTIVITPESRNYMKIYKQKKSNIKSTNNIHDLIEVPKNRKYLKIKQQKQQTIYNSNIKDLVQFPRTRNYMRIKQQKQQAIHSNIEQLYENYQIFKNNRNQKYLKSYDKLNEYNFNQEDIQLQAQQKINQKQNQIQQQKPEQIDIRKIDIYYFKVPFRVDFNLTIKYPTKNSQEFNQPKNYTNDNEIIISQENNYQPQQQNNLNNQMNNLAVHDSFLSNKLKDQQKQKNSSQKQKQFIFNQEEHDQFQQQQINQNQNKNNKNKYCQQNKNKYQFYFQEDQQSSQEIIELQQQDYSRKTYKPQKRRIMEEKEHIYRFQENEFCAPQEYSKKQRKQEYSRPLRNRLKLNPVIQTQSRADFFKKNTQNKNRNKKKYYAYLLYKKRLNDSQYTEQIFFTQKNYEQMSQFIFNTKELSHLCSTYHRIQMQKYLTVQQILINIRRQSNITQEQQEKLLNALWSREIEKKRQLVEQIQQMLSRKYELLKEYQNQKKSSQKFEPFLQSQLPVYINIDLNIDNYQSQMKQKVKQIIKTRLNQINKKQQILSQSKNYKSLKQKQSNLNNNNKNYYHFVDSTSQKLKILDLFIKQKQQKSLQSTYQSSDDETEKLHQKQKNQGLCLQQQSFIHQIENKQMNKLKLIQTLKTKKYQFSYLGHAEFQFNSRQILQQNRQKNNENVIINDEIKLQNQKLIKTQKKNKNKQIFDQNIEPYVIKINQQIVIQKRSSSSSAWKAQSEPLYNNKIYLCVRFITQI